MARGTTWAQRVDAYRYAGAPPALQLFPPRTRAIGLAGDYLPLLSEDERVIKMNEYSEEMRDFTDFLKSIYFDPFKVHRDD